MRGPCLDQRAIDAEMFVTQQLAHSRLIDNGFKQLPCNVRLEQRVPVRAEGEVIPHRLIYRKLRKPAASNQPYYP